MASTARRYAERLFVPVDGASLGAFRIVFGAAVAAETWLYLATGWVGAHYIQPALHFTYLYLDFMHPWPGRWMLVHFWLMSGLALFVAAGCWYRVTSVLLFAAYTYVFLLEQAVYMNHHYLICLLAFLLMLMPAERAFSVDRHWRPDVPRTVPVWTVWLLRFQLLAVYVYGAVAKLDYDWLRGQPMRSLLAEQLVEWPRLAPWVPIDMVGYGIAYSGIAADLAIPLLLVRARTFRFGFACALVFHGLNAVFLRIGVFSYLMLGAILIFLPPDWPRHRFRDLLRGHVLSPPVPPSAIAPWTARRWIILSCLILYASAQVLIPLRHLLYPGPVAWTEEGHRFSWRMMLRHKRSDLKLTAKDPDTGRVWALDPRHDLTARQLAKLHTFPDMLLQYVHHERERLRAEGIRTPIITVEWLCSLNGTAPQPLADPTINLAAEPRSLWPARWLLPLPPGRPYSTGVPGPPTPLGAIANP
jgi:vitamin K-dependent gamma-carboxylase